MAALPRPTRATMWYSPAVLLHRLVGVAAAWVLVAAFASSPARAYEDQIGLSLGAGYAHLGLPGIPEHGLQIDSALSIGLDDIWTLRGRFTYGYHPDPTAAVHTFVPSADVLYLIDILQWVPYLGAGVDGVVAMHDGNYQSEIGLHLAFGLDYLVSRSWLLELDMRPVVIVSALDEGPFYFVATLSAQWLFDY